MRDLLEPLVPPVDAEAGWRAVADRLPRARRRAVALRAAGVTVVVLVAAGIGLLALRAEGSGTKEAARFVEPSKGWVAFTDPATGLSVEYPANWNRADEVLAPMVVGDLGPQEVLALGTYPLDPTTSNCTHLPEAALEDLGPEDAFIWVARGPEGSGPSGSPLPRRGAVQLPGEPDSDARVAPCLDQPPEFAFSWDHFVAGDRVTYVLVALGPDASDRTRAEVLAIVESLEFDGAGTPTSPGSTAEAQSGADPQGTFSIVPNPARPGEVVSVRQTTPCFRGSLVFRVMRDDVTIVDDPSRPGTFGNWTYWFSPDRFDPGRYTIVARCERHDGSSFDYVPGELVVEEGPPRDEFLPGSLP